MNPFGDDSDEDSDEFTNPFTSRSTTNLRATTTTHQADEDKRTQTNTKPPAVSPPPVTTTINSRRAVVTNPFDDDSENYHNNNYHESELDKVEQESQRFSAVGQTSTNMTPNTSPVRLPSRTNAASAKRAPIDPFDTSSTMLHSQNQRKDKISTNPFDFEPDFDSQLFPDGNDAKSKKHGSNVNSSNSISSSNPMNPTNATHPSHARQSSTSIPSVATTAVKTLFRRATNSTVNFNSSESANAPNTTTSAKHSETVPIVQQMDKDDSTLNFQPSSSQIHKKHSRANTMSFQSDAKKSNKHHGFLRSKSDATNTSSTNNNLKWFGKHTDSPKRNKNIFVQCWPYDDYHKEQERYYQSIQDEEKSDSPALFQSLRSKSKEESGKKKKMTLLERPPELPNIKEAVQNLSLHDFEKKAQERAISIVSTWLFDGGLVDELLVSGVSNSDANTGRGRKNKGAYPVSQSVSNSSVRSSEGVEVGTFGFPIEGGLKMDKEIEKMKANRSRELTIINARLNDGVAASGTEVKELVNAVTEAKEDLGRLKELATYISSGYKKDMSIRKDPKDALILSDYPRLKRAINARRNIFRVFRELEFFSQIPLTCDRLRDELHSGEWSENEWNTIRDVCMEHVELEILLVEAESGMKAWLDDDEEADEDASMPSLRSTMSLKRSWKGRQNALLAGSHQVVDDFLGQHVKNVWELGDEIRMRILSGIGSAFDLALQNPAGMVALVEAVEVYERAAEQYNAAQYDKKKNGSETRLNFTNMRSAALAQLYEDFEIRGLELFRSIHMQAADMAEENDAVNSQFTAVLRAATELVAEIDVVKNQMAPCIAPHWHVEMLWSSCVAHVCSNQIIQQIGGPDGQNLPDLSVTQLLDLVAWVEFFRQTIEEAFPQIGSMHAKKTYFEERPDLFSGNERSVNMDNATDSLAWVNNMLWEVHRLAQEEFLLRTRSQTDELISKVYKRQHETTQTSEGRLFTSLCEDVFQLIGVQLRTIRERLTSKSDALVMTVCLVFSQLRAKQLTSRDVFLQSLESCCAAANDFQRMSEQVEDVVQDLIENSDLPEGSVKLIEENCGALVSIYSSDAVFAAQKIHCYVFEPLWDTISKDMFSHAWENEYTHNELALKITHTLDDFMRDLENFLDEFMLKKTVDALVASTVVFYIKCLLLTSEKHSSNKSEYFNDNAIAIERMDRDIKILRQYFDGLAEGMPALSKVVEKEFSVVTTIQEIMRIAAGQSDSNPEDFIVPLHKRLKDINITKHVVGDLWHLIQPSEERSIWELIESLETTLFSVCPPEPANVARDRMNVPGLRLDETLAKLYIESKRKRPVVAGVIEKMTTTMRKNWMEQ
jgi:hypothetical protein